MRYTLGDAQDDMLPPRLYNAKRDADISSIQLQHQAITSASTLAREMLEKEVARKNADKDRSIIDRMSKLIEILDTQTPQVLIEAKIVEATERFSRTINGSLGIGDASSGQWGAYLGAS